MLKQQLAGVVSLLPRGPAKNDLVGALATTDEAKFTPGYLQNTLQLTAGYIASAKHSLKKAQQQNEAPKQEDHPKTREHQTKGERGKKSACAHPKNSRATSKSVLEYKYPPSTTKVSTPDEIKNAVLTCFGSISTNFSGERSKTKHIELAEWQISQHLYAYWPKLLREECPRLKSQALQNTAKTLTKLTASMRTAVWSAEQPDFDEAKEIEARMVNFKAYYEAKLKRNKLRRAVTNKEYALLHRSLEGKITDAELDKWLKQTELVASLGFNAKTGNVATSEFDPQNYPIHPPSEETVAGILSEQKFKYTHKSYPKECPMCKREGVVEAELAFVYQQMAELRQKDEAQWSEDDKRLLLILKKCAGELETEKKTIAIHKKQLEICRSFIKQLTAKLKPG